MKHLALLLLFAGALATHAGTAGDPLACWRDGVTVRPVTTETNRHVIHAYFNTCPESPDGSNILFFASTTPDGQRGQVMLRNRFTGAERKLGLELNTEDAHRTACQQWVSGGRRVVFHGEREGQWFTAVADVATGQERVLARDRLAGWGQPNADVVPLYGLHWKPGAHRDLELANVATGEIKTTATVEALREAFPDFLKKNFGAKSVSIFFPVLSPDLNRVFFKLAAPGGGDPRSKLASTRLGMVCYSLHDQKFLRADKRWGHPAWHPDARTIVEAGHLLIDSKSGATQRILGLPNCGSGHPSASPDGKLLVTDVSMNHLGGKSSDWSVLVADMRGTNYTTLATFDGSRGAKSWRRSHPHPVFSADGKRIYFNVNSSPWTQLFVAEARGSQP
jgi:Tol biopolymer transport system component